MDCRSKVDLRLPTGRPAGLPLVPLVQRPVVVFATGFLGDRLRLAAEIASSAPAVIQY